MSIQHIPMHATGVHKCVHKNICENVHMYTSHNNWKLFNSLFTEWDTFPQWEGMSYNPTPPYGWLSEACWWDKEARHKIIDLMSWIHRNEAQRWACSRRSSGRGSPDVCTLMPLVRKGFFRVTMLSGAPGKHSACLGYSGEPVLTLCSTFFQYVYCCGMSNLWCLNDGALLPFL